MLFLALTWNWAAAVNILSQDFESVWDLNSPPTGWTIIDLGTEGQQCWYIQDWHKRFYSYWDDTVAYINYSPRMESEYDEWMITPDIVVPGGASACSLTFDTFYDDAGTTALGDSAFIKISADGGAHWTTLETWGSDMGSLGVRYYANIDFSSYIGQTVRFGFNLKTHGTTSYTAIRTWVIDNVAVWADASTLLSFDFNGWGPWGDNPPAGWTIYDYGVPMPAAGVPNNNDWHRYPVWGSYAARVYYDAAWYSEHENEWLISPVFAIGTGNACTLSFAQYYNHIPNTPYDGDHGYIKVSTDRGASWPYTIEDLTETTGDQYTITYFKYDLGAFAGETELQIAFNFVNLPTPPDWWAIDDVSIDEYAPITQDPGVVSIDAPPDLIFTGANYTITATIENFLSDSTIIDSVLFQVDSDEAPEVVFSNTIYPAVYLQGYASQQFSSSAQWTPNPDDRFIVTVTVFGSGDENPLNNSYVADRYAQSAVAFPFVEDFESDIITSVWDWVGLGEGFGTTSNAHSPVTALWFDDDAIYPAERLAVSPPIHVSGSFGPDLKFWERSADQNGPQGQEIHTVGLVAGEWNLENLVVLFQEDTSSTTLEDSLWRETIVDAGDIEGDTLRLVFWYHCGDFPDRSWYVDDVSLSDPPGTVAGQVTDANTTNPIEGAIVTASSDVEDIIVDTTDAGGNYSIDIASGPTTVTVEANGYVPDTNQVIVYPNQTTTHDVALTAPVATIDTSPIYSQVDIGDTALYSMYLYNTGTAGLDYDVTLEEPEGVPALLSVNVGLKNESAADKADSKLNNAAPLLNVNKQPLPVILDITWMTVTSGQAGSVVPGDSAEIVFMVDFRDMSIVPDSTYSADAIINNNDPYSIPVISFHIQAVEPIGRCCYDDTLCADNTIPECFVLGGDWNPDLNCTDNPCPPPGCDYVVGDINGSSSYNGLDITYGVAFFKGGSDPQCIDCPLCLGWWYCGDVNASCNYNGLDITYGVAYFKGGSPPQPCGDCPPIE